MGSELEQKLYHAVELHRQGNLGEAANLYRIILVENPRHADALHHLGVIAFQTGRRDRGLDLVERAIECNELIATYHSSRASMLEALGKPIEANKARSQAGTLANSDRYRWTTRPKLQHDIEQIEYLKSIGVTEPWVSNALQGYREVLEQIHSDGQDGKAAPLHDDLYAKIKESYNRPIHIAEAPVLERGAVNPDLNSDTITRAYFDSEPEMTFFDDLLRPEAMESLRRYCLESTMWFDFRHRGGYVGAYQTDGFDAPLLGQIAEELRETLPEVLGAHPLRYVWAFKYDSELYGIGPHADEAAVNVNFWITPDEANLDPETGGLRVYGIEAPSEWDFNEYNTDQERVKRFLADSGAPEWIVPHRQGRTVMFNSNLFHATDTIRFRPGYTNRRINITMLFGDRRR